MNETKRFVQWHRKDGSLSKLHVVDVSFGMVTYCSHSVPEGCKFVNDPDLDEVVERGCKACLWLGFSGAGDIYRERVAKEKRL